MGVGNVIVAPRSCGTATPPKSTVVTVGREYRRPGDEVSHPLGRRVSRQYASDPSGPISLFAEVDRVRAVRSVDRLPSASGVPIRQPAPTRTVVESVLVVCVVGVSRRRRDICRCRRRCRQPDRRLRCFLPPASSSKSSAIATGSRGENSGDAVLDPDSSSSTVAGPRGRDSDAGNRPRRGTRGDHSPPSVTRDTAGR